MNLFTVLAAATFAGQTVISPLPDTRPVFEIEVTAAKPDRSFAELSDTLASQSVMGTATAASPSAAIENPLPKTSYKIAVLGDSMVDTLGPGIPLLQSGLSGQYPGTAFTVLNYGVGATNIEYGIKRLHEPYEYLGAQVEALLSVKPDVIVVESFGYNPLSLTQDRRNDHWLNMAKIIETIRDELPETEIVIAATIAPNDRVFGDGAPGIAFDAEEKSKRVRIIREYIENAVALAGQFSLPLADAYHDSLDADGNGKLSYINNGDHIHYSDAGRKLMTDKISRAIIDNRLLY